MNAGWFVQFAIVVIVIGTVIMLVRLTKVPDEFKTAVLYIGVAALVIWVLQSLLLPLAH